MNKIVVLATNTLRDNLQISLNTRKMLTVQPSNKATMVPDQFTKKIQSFFCQQIISNTEVFCCTFN